MILRDDPDKVIGISRFLDRQPELVAKLFDKKRIKARNLKIPIDHFRKLKGVIRTFDIQEDMWFNMVDKGYIMGMSDRCKVIWEGE